MYVPRDNIQITLSLLLNKHKYRAALECVLGLDIIISLFGKKGLCTKKKAVNL